MSAGPQLTLVGMPWSGKSTVGRALADALACPFVDTDDLICERLGGHFAELAARDPAAFGALEQEVVCALAPHHGVVATGGSVVYGERAVAHLRRAGTVIHLDVSAAEIARRAGDVAARGIVIAPGMTLADLHAERAPLYHAAAHHTVRTDNVDDAVGLALDVAAAVWPDVAVERWQGQVVRLDAEHFLAEFVDAAVADPAPWALGPTHEARVRLDRLTPAQRAEVGRGTIFDLFTVRLGPPGREAAAQTIRLRAAFAPTEAEIQAALETVQAEFDAVNWRRDSDAAAGSGAAP